MGWTGVTGPTFLPAMIHLGHLIVSDAIVLPTPGRGDKNPDLEVIVLGAGKAPDIPDDSPVGLCDLFDTGEGIVRHHQRNEDPVVVPGGEEVSRCLLILELDDDISLGLQHGRRLPLEGEHFPEFVGGGHEVAPPVIVV